MSKTDFKISYGGPAVENGTMDVSDLAPALLAVGEIFREINKELNGERAEVKTNVVAVKEGCFDVILGVDQTLIQQAIDFLNSEEVAAALKLKALLFGTGGLIWFYKRLRGRDPKNVESLGKNKVRIVIDENDSIEISTNIRVLSQNPHIRQAIEKLISSPLKSEGIESFKISDQNNEETIEKEEAPYFEYKILDGKTIHDNTIEKTFSIVALSFKPNNKWRLFDGENIFGALINDQKFLEEVATGEKRFAKDDILVCQFRMKQTIEDSKLKTEYSVEKVIDHRNTPKQPTLLSK